jgi:hypothetical protein
MSRRDEHWGAEDEDVARRLRDEKSRLSGFELDRIKTTVMARVKPSSAPRRSAPISRWLVGLLTVGAMVAGTAGTLAASNSSDSGGTGAAQSQYRPPKCNPRHEECTCPGGSQRVSRDRCVCPPGQAFGERSNDCFCPNGTHPVEGKCRHHERDTPTGGPVTHGTPPPTKKLAPTNKAVVKPKARRTTRSVTRLQARVHARRERR